MSKHFDLSRFEAVFSKANARIGTNKAVYCISEGSGYPVKIGITDNVGRRFSQLQANTWRKLVLCWSAPGWSLHEAAIKRVMAGRVLHNEWFHDADDRIKDMMRLQPDLRTAIEALSTAQADGATQ